MIAMIDYGMGNLKSVYNAFLSLGETLTVTADPEVVRRADKVILPGVGAFGDAMGELRSRNLEESIKEVVVQQKPLLGICLGLQLLYEGSEEQPGVEGLGIVPGRIRRFDQSLSAQGYKIPHMGWNTAHIRKSECPLVEGITGEPYFYFVHSYCAACSEVTLSETVYGESFSSMIWKDMVFATQFHPEKSQRVGLLILQNFISL